MARLRHHRVEASFRQERESSARIINDQFRAWIIDRIERLLLACRGARLIKMPCRAIDPFFELDRDHLLVATVQCETRGMPSAETDDERCAAFLRKERGEATEPD